MTGRLPRIALVTHVYFPHIGGAVFNHHFVAQALRRDADVRVFTSDLSITEAGGQIDPRDRQQSWEGVPVDYLPSVRFLGERLVPPLSLLRALRSYQPDVVWTNSPTLSADVGASYARLNGRPWVATYHADLREDSGYGRAYNRLETIWLRRARKVLVNGGMYRDRLIARGLDPDRVIAVTPGPALGRGAGLAGFPGPDREGWRPGPEHALLFVGGLDRPRRYKRPDRLIEAVGRIRAKGVPVHATLVGDGLERPHLERLARTLGLADAIRFAGHVSDGELARTYRNAWALVLPSTPAEGFGLVALEAIQYGCPVVTTQRVECGPILDALGCALLYDDTIPSAFETALERIWTDGALRTRMSYAAERAGPRFSWDRAAEELRKPILEAAQEGLVARTAGPN